MLQRRPAIHFGMAATTGPSEERARNGEFKGVGKSNDWPYHVVGQGAADLSSLGATSLTGFMAPRCSETPNLSCSMPCRRTSSERTSQRLESRQLRLPKTLCKMASTIRRACENQSLREPKMSRQRVATNTPSHEKVEQQESGTCFSVWGTPGSNRRWHRRGGDACCKACVLDHDSLRGTSLTIPVTRDYVLPLCPNGGSAIIWI